MNREKKAVAKIALLICAAITWLSPFPREIVRADDAPPSPRHLTKTNEIRQLATAEARQSLIVTLRGVVLYYEKAYDLIIQDDTASIYVAADGYYLRPGQEVEIDGYTTPGDFVPDVHATSVRIIGEGVLPVGRAVTYDDLMTGKHDAQWVTVHGIVRSARVDKTLEPERAQIELAMENGRIAVRFADVDIASADRLVDSEATITGVCFSLFNRKRQLFDVRLAAPSLAQVKAANLTSENPFAAHATPVSRLMQFDLSASRSHRVKVTGQLLLQKPGEGLFLKDAEQGLWVATKQPTRLSPGDEIEVLGFPAHGAYSPILEDAVFHALRKNVPASPTRVTIEKALEGNYDADLIQLEAQLIDQRHNGNETVLLLRKEDFVFRATVEQNSAQPLPDLVPNSRLMVTGVCQVQMGDQRWPQSFRLLLRGPEDIAVLERPSAWTLRGILIAATVLLAAFLVPATWALTLRRQVSAQTQIIRDNLQREAVLKERTRIAREFHDTLEQQLAGVGLQLETAADKLDESPDFAKRTFRIAQSMLRHTRSEARRSVWELRACALRDGNLAAALETIVKHSQNGHPIQSGVIVSGEPMTLPVQVESNLLRIGQEAVANSVKHANAKSISINLQYNTDSVQLSVRDDGCGFSDGSVPGPEAGHFGLLGMRERAEKIGGHFHVTSVPNQGTKIEITVPLPTKNGE